jgi:hypothetical protein
MKRKHKNEEEIVEEQISKKIKNEGKKNCKKINFNKMNNFRSD